MARTYENDTSYYPGVLRARWEELHSPPPPPLAVRKEMKEVDNGDGEEIQPECPTWIKLVCDNRTVFTWCVLHFGAAPPFESYILAWGSQQPCWATFSRLLPRPEWASTPSGEPEEIGWAMPPEGAEVWLIEDMAWVQEDAAEMTMEPSFVVPEVHFGRKGLCWSEKSREPWEDFTEAMPRRQEKTGSKKKDNKWDDPDADDDTLKAKLPWLRRLVDKETPKSKGKHKAPKEAKLLEDCV